MTASRQRRRWLQAMLGAGSMGALPESIARALAMTQPRGGGSLRDIEHIIILVQENRSFDQMFGTLAGVRGFNDPRPARLPGGNSVLAQPGSRGLVYPFRPELPQLGMQFLADVDHDWASSHGAWNHGRYDGWVAAKGPGAMQYFDRSDIPYHFALAEAFTVCDAYHCSMMGPTDPNRYFLWTGGVGGREAGDGGPVVDNAEAGYSWATLPQALSAAGLRWKVYQDIGAGLDAQGKWGWTKNPHVGNFGDNALLYFQTFRDAPAGTVLFEAARTGTNAAAGESLFAQLARDIDADALAAVSWIVAPEAYSEHPNWPPNYGAWYVSKILDSLTARPEVWSKTALFLTYDEAGGFFDHMIPPTPALGAAGGGSVVDVSAEWFPGGAKAAPGPLGLGNRVPMIIVSPWTAGGWVCSQLFDHTSLIRFIEARFGAEHPSLKEAMPVSSWRRTVCGDLQSAFDFSRRAQAPTRELPSTEAFAPTDRERHPDVILSEPLAAQAPRQERGRRKARPLPYALEVNGQYLPGAGFALRLSNPGAAGVCVQVRAHGEHGFDVWSYTLAAGADLSANLPLSRGSGRDCIEVHGPDGFFREFRREGADAVPEVEASVHLQKHGALLHLRHLGTAVRNVEIGDRYANTAWDITLQPGEVQRFPLDVRQSAGWYEIRVAFGQEGGQGRFEQVFAGHLQDGRPGWSDPLLG